MLKKRGDLIALFRRKKTLERDTEKWTKADHYCQQTTLKELQPLTLIIPFPNLCLALYV